MLILTAVHFYSRVDMVDTGYKEVGSLGNDGAHFLYQLPHTLAPTLFSDIPVCFYPTLDIVVPA